MDLATQRRHLYNGFGNALATAFELAVIPVIFWFLGRSLDRWLGAAPLFTAVLLTFSVVGLSVRAWYRYVADMERMEEGAPWRR